MLGDRPLGPAPRVPAAGLGSAGQSLLGAEHGREQRPELLRLTGVLSVGTACASTSFGHPLAAPSRAEIPIRFSFEAGRERARGDSTFPCRKMLLPLRMVLPPGWPGTPCPNKTKLLTILSLPQSASWHTPEEYLLQMLVFCISYLTSCT